MRIKLKKVPVILIAEGKSIGEVQGFVIIKEADNRYKVTSIYGIWEDKYFSIPLKHITIGPDAMMVWDEKMIQMLLSPFLSISVDMCIYDEQGENWGQALAVHIDEEFVINGIEINDKKVDMASIISIGDAIVVWSDKTPVIDNENSFIEEPFQEESVELKGLQPLDNEYENQQDQINPKYQYLIGKKFLESVEIGENTYSEGAEITFDIIEQALHNNAILRIIMNAED